MKYVSETWKSSAGLAMMTPVRPPKRKVTRKPIAQSMGVSIETLPPHIVPIQLKNFSPVGTAMSIDITAKNGKSTCPVTYMWCAQTLVESAAMAIVANAMVL